MARQVGVPERRQQGWPLSQVLVAVGLVSIVFSLIVAGWLFYQPTGVQAHAPSSAHVSHSVLARANQWNQDLVKSGQPVIGEPVLADGSPGGDFSGSTMPGYMDQLNQGQGIMGEVAIPRIGVELTIRHGASSQVLDRSAGHIPGTSLPVGGVDTHTVITAHRGVPGKGLFTRLDEVQVGDPFYLKVAGRVLAYRVIDVREIDPHNVEPLRVIKGKDLASLMTCTPYGVNTKRLLVTGMRASMPGQAPFPQDAPGDPVKPLLAGVGTSLGVFLLLTVVLLWCRPKVYSIRHRSMNEQQ